MATSDLPHVLVVGENPAGTSSMCEMLASAPVRCTAASGTRQAFAVVRTGVDVALLDVSGLRPSDGLTLVRRLRDETEDLGVVMVADRRSLEDLVDALRIGVVDFLSKPLGAGELSDAVQRAVEWRSTTRASRHVTYRYEQEMAQNAISFKDVLVDAGIATTMALETYLGRLYGKHVAAFEHARRVASAAALIAAELHVAEPVAGHIERAALLHDVGKLTIPKAIMRKGWPLTAREHALIRSHVRVAADAAAAVPFLFPTAEMLVASRERFDGSGFPLALSGTAIPLGARIIAVAEAYDTLSTGRTASAPGSIHVANAELVRGAGTLFDPDIVNVWLRCLDRFESDAHQDFQS